MGRRVGDLAQEPFDMAGRHRIATYIALSLAWAAFAAWQYHSYRRDCNLIKEALRQPGHSLMKALIGAIVSHRWPQRFFDEDMQGLLDGLTTSEDVLAVGVASSDRQLTRSAGRAELVKGSSAIAPGDFWDPEGFRIVEPFQMPAASPPGRGGGQGFGRRLGRGLGPPRRADAAVAPGPFSEGGEFLAVLVLDRSRSDALCRAAARSHLLVAAAGALALLCMAFVWRASVRLVEARGRAEVLEAEARHLREMGQAAAGLAHETRNPLGLVRGWTQRLAQSDADALERREQAQAVIEECDRVAARINQFLAFARPAEPSLTLLDVEQLIGELAIILQPDLEAKGLKLERSVPRRARSVLADRELLRAALFNLLQNAIQFSSEGDTVEIAVESGRNVCCRIDVADRGPGVASDAVESLFAPYYTTRPDGAGLGLAMVRRIASAHGWEAAYAPRPGGGSVFSLDGIHGRDAKDDSGS
jgi:signal transduction histidine kinase